ncbi:efflux RND transporter periplasmic adaptor subunit (plasmid) [Cupriavidus sp. KK10]|jgi:membrane fusion protein (multidrug efflux system)|uniref:efflux RND transporter periplasmic adaptor subunit n=1 Tax=Cupriavidus sp. KK10 TaxID=1478019 RepID=UPI001BA768FB|nr:efflux RND transporter periplasmic adaptor subunit [Cupriavidus sp. KK10]QUN32860.1 efflux RND transporter periplasmic adaptor subunit [Cupriavidus sp. KK10]
MNVTWIRIEVAGAVAGTLALAACGQKPPVHPPALPEVGVIAVAPQAIATTTELPGRTNAFLVAQVRARVDGIVQHRGFNEGEDVKEGQRLYKIDPAPYIAASNSAKASLAKARANAAAAAALAERDKPLVAANAISKQEYDNAVAAAGQAAAEVAAAKAAVETAQINLHYTDVISPISGRVGISQVTPGAYVQTSQATLMATVQQLDPMYVDLTQSSVDGLRLRREFAEGKLDTAGPNAAAVTLTLEDGRAYPLQGKLQFSDVTVDQTTGSVTIRAIFPNPNHVLLPGMFVRARIQEGLRQDAYLVPQIGITHDQKGHATALVVGQDSKVLLRQVVASSTSGTNWIVESGLKAGDRVVVEGTEKVRPGMVVKTIAAR